MTDTNKLTATQIEVLNLATYRPDGNIEPLPPQLRGGARKKIIESLVVRALVATDSDNYLLTDAGFAAVGRQRKTPVPVAPEAEDDAAEAITEGTPAQVRPASCTRENSKQATVIQMLQRPEGATIPQIMAATGWQAHSVRGCMAGSLKKKLGLTITSEKAEGCDRLYHIA